MAGSKKWKAHQSQFHPRPVAKGPAALARTWMGCGCRCVDQAWANQTGKSEASRRNERTAEVWERTERTKINKRTMLEEIQSLD